MYIEQHKPNCTRIVRIVIRYYLLGWIYVVYVETTIFFIYLWRLLILSVLQTKM